VGQITNPKKFHPQCRPQEVFDPRSGSCIPITNTGKKPPAGTLECVPGFVLDEKMGDCVPESPTSQAVFKPTGKMERCIMKVKDSLVKRNPRIDKQALKSSAIAICRSKLKQ